MKKIFITATNTDIGKTYTTLKLLQALHKKGYKVGAMKPIETGVEQTPQDGMKLFTLQQRLNPDLAHLKIEDVVPIQFQQPAAPFIASNLQTIDVTPLFEAAEKFSDSCDILLIEGAGGLLVPINAEYCMIDLIHDLKVDATLLVTHCVLGCINDTLLSHKFLESYNLPHIVAFNCQEGDSFATTSKPYFDHTGFETLIVDKDIETIATKLLHL